MSEISNKKKKFIKRNFKQLSIEELSGKTGLKPRVIRSLLNEYTAEASVKNQHSPKKPIHDKGPFKKRHIQTILMWAISVSIITFLIYIPALKNDFVWDDTQYVLENTLIYSLSLDSLSNMLTTFHASNWHPLSWLSHAIDYAVWGLDPSGHHLTNIILHGLNTFLVFLLVIKLVLRAKGTGRTLTQSLFVAGITSLFFGLHPLHVESVAWVAERKDLLCAFFFLLTLLCYLSYSSSAVKKHRWTWFTISLLLFTFALMSKPMAVTLPIVLLILDLYPLNRIKQPLYKNLSLLLEKIPFFILSTGSSILTIIAQHSGGAVISFERFPIGFRLLNALHSLSFYLKKMILPFELVPFYPSPKYIHPLDLQYIISGISVFAITAICLLMLKRRKYLFFSAWSYYLITLLPVIGIVQVGGQAAADRYLYLPSISPFLLIGTGIAWTWQKAALMRGERMMRALILIFIFIAISLLSSFTVKQTRIWQNSEILWSYIINAFPGRIPFAHDNLGNVYFKKGMLDEATSEHKKALIIDPHFAKAHNNLGLVYFKKDRLDEAIYEFKEALAINTNLAEAHTNLGFAYFRKRRLDEAISECKKALSIKPHYVEAHINLGLAYFEKGMPDKAIYEFKQAIAVNPDYAEAHSNLGVAYTQKGRYNEAIFAYKQAIAVNPDYVKAHYNLGDTYIKTARLDDAISEYKQAIAINPDYAAAHARLSAAYYQKRNYKSAIVHCDRAAKLGENINPGFLELLKPYR